MKWKILGAIAVGLTGAIGLAVGLTYTWVLDVPEDYDAAPDSLRTEDKSIYLALIGDLYAYEQDLDLAEARLAELDVEADGQVLARYIERYLDGGGRPEEVRNLARLAEALGASGGVLVVFGSEATPTSLPTVTLPAQPGETSSPAPTVTPAPRFALLEQTALCAEPGQPGQIAVRVRDATGAEMAGVEIVVRWSTGEDRLFTGLRPEKGPGYADFQMAPQVRYEVSLAKFEGETAQGLTADLISGTCPTATLAIDWRLTFQEIQ